MTVYWGKNAECLDTVKFFVDQGATNLDEAAQQAYSVNDKVVECLIVRGAAAPQDTQ